MENYYEILGVNSSATPQELRRAYRILARRYHPDVNPGKASQEKFRLIASAYSTLNDPAKRRAYDLQLESYIQANARAGHKIYEANQKNGAAASAAKKRSGRPDRKAKEGGERVPKTSGIWGQLFGIRRDRLKPEAPPSRQGGRSVTKISILEVSVNIKDAIMGAKKTIEISEPDGPRKISIKIPSGVRNGSVIRLKGRTGLAEEIVLIVRVASHPFLSLHSKGLVVEIPISVNEAISGASITVPTLDEPMVIKIPPASQSGHEIRLKDRGILQRDGSRGDLFFRLMIKVPESADAIGIKEKAGELNSYYACPVRQSFPKALLEL